MRKLASYFILTTLALQSCQPVFADGYSTNFHAVADYTPDFGASTNVWAFSHSPGTYYWNGFYTGSVIGFLSIVLGAGVRYWGRE